MTGRGRAASSTCWAASGVIEERIRHLVAVRRADDPAPDDPFRGLYLSDDAVDRLLVGPRPPPDWTQTTDRWSRARPPRTGPRTPGAVLRLRDLAANFGLDPVDVDLLLVGIAADVDPRFESFFGYLNDDVSRRRPSVAVALELAGVSLTSMQRPRPPAPRAPRGRWSGGARRARPAVPGPCAARAGPRRVVPAGRRRAGPRAGTGDRHRSRRAVGRPVAPGARDRRRGHPGLPPRAGHRIGPRARRRGAAADRAPAARHRALTGSPRSPIPTRLAGLAVREARLAGAGIVAGPVSAVQRDRPELLQHLVADPRPLLVVGDMSWDPGWTRQPPLLVVGPAEHAGGAAHGVAVRPRRVGVRRVMRWRRRRSSGSDPRTSPERHSRRGSSPPLQPGRPGHRAPPAPRRSLGERVRARAPGPPHRADGLLGGPGAATRMC